MSSLQIYRRIEDVVTPDIIKDPLVEKVIRRLESFDFKKNIYSDSPEYQILMDYRPTLNPMQIFEISRYMKKLPENFGKADYLSTLINISHIWDYADFTIDNKEERGLANSLRGTPERILKIKILSNIGTAFATNSKYCHIIAEQNLQETGTNLKNCFVEIKQDLEELNIWNSYNSTFKIRGKIKSIKPIKSIRPDSKSENITIILNQEQYKKCKENPKIKDNKYITLKVLEE